MAYRSEHDKKRRKIGWIILFSILLFFALAAFLVIRVCRVESVEIEGNELYDDDSIRMWVLNDKYSWNTLYVYLKYRFFDTEPVPFIDTMEVEIKDPKTLFVKVYEKGLIGYIPDETTGQYVYFDKDGFVIEIGPNRMEGLPEVTGISAEGAMVFEKLPASDKTLKTLLALTQNLEKYHLSPDSIQIAGTGDLTVTFGPVTVRLGKEDFLTEKIMRLPEILPQIEGMAGVLYLENWTNDTTDVTFTRMV